MTTRVYHQRQPARIVLFGMRCGFTAQVLAALAAAPGVNLRAVVLSGRVDRHPDVASDAVLDTVQKSDTTLIGLADRLELVSPEFQASLEANAPDLIVVACFPWRFPTWLLALPEGGCLNVHPSLLPDGRGPEPVFWAFRWGLTETGVTVHLMDAGFDTGPMVAQGRVAIPLDATIASLERTLVRLGAELLIACLPTVLDGSATFTSQVGEQARYAAMPGPEDLVVSTNWTAGDAARFIRAVVPTYGPVTVLVQSAGQRLAVTEAVGVEEGAIMPVPVRIVEMEARIQFSPGVLICRLAAHSQPLRLLPDV